MQIPVGILLDRFGSRRLLIIGAVIMAFGQAIVGFSVQIAPAIFGRMLVGLGDAFIFISLVRLVNGWYQGKRATRVQQLVTNVGQMGQAASAIPFAWFLHTSSWAVAFLSLAFLLVLVAFGGWFLIANDRPSKTKIVRASSLAQAVKNLRRNLKHPGVWLSFWTHFSVQSASSLFLLLWGMPFLVSAQGLSRSEASLMLASIVVFGFFSGPAVSWFCTRWPGRRHQFVLAVMLTLGVTLAGILIQPQAAPPWMLWAWIFVLGVSSPTSMIAFDFSRSFVPKESLGAVNGFVNVGGFTATFIMMFVAGLVLDGVRLANHSIEVFTFEGFRVALWVELATLAVGAAFIVSSQSKSKRLSASAAPKE
jgi:nitrate/nitrite transporter NarK